MWGFSRRCGNRHRPRLFGRIWAGVRELKSDKIRAPAEAQRQGELAQAKRRWPGPSGFGGKRRSSEIREFSPIWGGNEGYGAGDDVKQDKEQASSVTPCSVTSARSAGSYGGFRGVPKWGQKQKTAITFTVVIPESLLPQRKNGGHAPERSSF